jgi:hypothetical protein
MQIYNLQSQETETGRSIFSQEVTSARHWQPVHGRLVLCLRRKLLHVNPERQILQNSVLASINCY